MESLVQDASDLERCVCVCVCVCVVSVCVGGCVVSVGVCVTLDIQVSCSSDGDQRWFIGQWLPLVHFGGLP